jgi:hypothetical protein
MHMVHDNDLERLKIRRKNHVRCVEDMWQRVRKLESYEGEPCALTHGVTTRDCVQSRHGT